MHRFFVAREAIQNGRVELPAEQAHQVRNVLRMKPGQCVVVLDNEGWEYEVSLDQVGRQQVAGEITGQRPVANEPVVQITLYQSLMKREKFEWVLQKGSEIGVSHFVPLITRRSIVQKPGAITPKKMARWQRIVTEAAEQSRRGRVPTIGTAVSFAEAVDSLDRTQIALIPWEESADLDVRTALANHKAKEIALFIGPEGGFAAEEIEYAGKQGAIPITLGPRILRAETAALVTAALVLYELGELA